MKLHSKHSHIKKNQQIMILPLTKNSAEMFRDYLKEETLKKRATKDKLTQHFPDLSLE